MMKLAKYILKKNQLIYLSVCCVLFFSFKPATSVTVENLRCELLVNPEGIDQKYPRLSWEIQSKERNVTETYYHILVASSKEKLMRDEGDLWNSGKINSTENIHINYAGLPLKSKVQCFWKVKIGTNKGESTWSEPAYWSMGLLNQVDWKGRWIGLDRSFPWDRENQFSRLSARYFRKEIEVKKPIKRAMMYLMGLGLYELHINENKIGDQVLAPAPTDYTKGLKYNTFDITADLKGGLNAIGVILGNGRFYTMRQDYKPYKIKTFGYPKMLFQLELEYEDGGKETIKCDDTWKVTSDGPIRSNNEYDGEEYDATKEMPGWNKPGFDDKGWLKAEYVQEPGGMYEAQMNENMKVMETIKPVKITKLSADTYILDMGQNFAGWIKMRVKGNKGDQVSLRFAESLQADGSLFTRNLRDAKVTDLYILKGGEEEVWEPSFVYHGFRYVEISNYPGTPTLNDFEGKVVYDNINTTGQFETSNPTINQIYQNAYWGILSNYKGMPVDCPQRNERQPWLGDRTTGAHGESFIFDNAKLYVKWLTDIQQSQKADGSIPDVAPAFWRYYGDNVTWPGTYLSVANMLYDQYGDKESVAKHYESMKKWVNYMKEQYLKDNILIKDKYGDWCVPPESKELIHSRDSTRKTDGTLIATATYYRMLSLMERFAGILDKPEDIKEYKNTSTLIREAFNNKFLNRRDLHYGNNTVTANLLPLAFDMIPSECREGVVNNIVVKTVNENRDHISTGVIGTQWLMRGLTENGNAALSYRIASNRTYPSWGYMVENGATTIWELWNGNTANPEMNSQNHVMLLGDLIIWYYENLAGIKTEPARPGFKHIIMKPEIINGLDFVNASYQSVRGKIVSEWKKSSKKFEWKITIPANTTATIYIPARSKEEVYEGKGKASLSKDLKFIRMENGKAVFEIGSGTYSIKSKL
jgi:alpha-L-rhamnosidase